MFSPSSFLEFKDKGLLAELVGAQNHHLVYLEEKLSVSLSLRGNQINISGKSTDALFAKKVLIFLYNHLQQGFPLGITEIDYALHLVSHQNLTKDNPEDLNNAQQNSNYEVSILTKRRLVVPRSFNQANYIQAMQAHELVFGLGPAGTGKTYLAVAQAVSLLSQKKIDRIILSRPAVEAGERLGFLPGDLKEKIDPYLRPLYDALREMLPADQVIKYLNSGEIEVAPLAFMRGRTLSNAFVILDEAQNSTVMQMKMLLTRLGAHSRMVINGDLTQIDLPRGVLSGLENSVKVLEGVQDIAFINFDEKDVVRHPLVAKIVKAYNFYDKQDKTVKR